MHRERPLLYKLLVGQTDLYQISPNTSPCVGVHTPASQERVPIAYVMRPGDWHPLSVLPFRPKSQSLTVSTCRFGQFSPELSWELSGDVPATLSPDPLQSSPGSSLATFRPHCRRILSRALLGALWIRSGHIVARSSPELCWELSGDGPARLPIHHWFFGIRAVSHGLFPKSPRFFWGHLFIAAFKFIFSSKLEARPSRFRANLRLVLNKTFKFFFGVLRLLGPGRWGWVHGRVGFFFQGEFVVGAVFIVGFSHYPGHVGQL